MSSDASFASHFTSVCLLIGTLMSSTNIDSNGNHVHNGTLPLRSSAYSCPNSTQLTATTMSTMDRPNSNSSNVYQTIDADRFVTRWFRSFFQSACRTFIVPSNIDTDRVVICTDYHQTVRHSDAQRRRKEREWRTLRRISVMNRLDVH